MKRANEFETRHRCGLLGLLFGLALGVAGCARDGAVPLLSGVVAITDAQVERSGSPGTDELTLEYDHAAGVLWVEQRVPAEAFRGGLPGGGFEARLAEPVLDAASGRLLASELIVGGRPFELVSHVRDARPSAETGRRDIGAAREDRLVVFTANGEAPGTTRVMERRLGRDSAGRVRIEGFSGAGFIAPRGHRVRLQVPAGPAGKLVWTAIAPRRADEERGRGSWRLPAAAVVRQTGGNVRGPQRVELELRASARVRPVELAYTGTSVFGALLEPRFFPAAQAESPPVSPPEDARQERPRDVLLFVADTFRADNLSAYRGRPGGLEGSLTPFLDGLFEQRAAWFEDAWSPASWTLPAHASMFTGLYPPEHTADRPQRRLPEGLEVLSERFGAAGYRCVAITDGAYLSPTYGLARGFDLFAEGSTDMARTTSLVAAALDDPDPRPLFLFVQTYRVHSPYVADAATRESLAGVLELGEETYPELEDQLRRDPSRRDRRLPRPLSVVRRLGELYRAGARGFDAEFAELWQALVEREFLEHGGLVVFTADHGEAFGERGVLGHGKGLEESQTRVPLAFIGSGVTPGRRSGYASLVDLGSTLIGAAGLGAAGLGAAGLGAGGAGQGPLGRGRDLLAAGSSAERAVYAFQLDDAGEPQERAAWLGGAKLVWSADDEGARRLELPIDARRDRGESTALAPEYFAEFERPAVAPAALGELSASARKRLEALGYL